MKKRYIPLIMLLFIILLGTVCHAEQELGYAKFTDIVTYINHYPIQSHNFQGKTLIAAEDLKHFGFNVKWNEYKRILTITRDKAVKDVDIPYVTCPIKSQIGKNEFMVKTTDVRAFTESYEYATYGGITGYTLINIEDLACIDGVTICWVPEVRALKIWVEGLHESACMCRPIPNYNYYELWGYDSFNWHGPEAEFDFKVFDNGTAFSFAWKGRDDYYYEPVGLYGYGCSMTTEIVDVLDANGDSILKKRISANDFSVWDYYYGYTDLPFAQTVFLSSSDLIRRTDEDGGVIKFNIRLYGESTAFSKTVDHLPYGEPMGKIFSL